MDQAVHQRAACVVKDLSGAQPGPQAAEGALFASRPCGRLAFEARIGEFARRWAVGARFKLATFEQDYDTIGAF
jgi:hypothetical protein